MNKTELIKGILKLSEELDKAEGFATVVIINDMDKLVDKYVEQLTMPIVSKSFPSKEDVYNKADRLALSVCNNKREYELIYDAYIECYENYKNPRK